MFEPTPLSANGKGFLTEGGEQTVTSGGGGQGPDRAYRPFPL